MAHNTGRPYFQARASQRAPLNGGYRNTSPPRNSVARPSCRIASLDPPTSSLAVGRYNSRHRFITRWRKTETSDLRRARVAGEPRPGVGPSRRRQLRSQQGDHDQRDGDADRSRQPALMAVPRCRGGRRPRGPVAVRAARRHGASALRLVAGDVQGGHDDHDHRRARSIRAEHLLPGLGALRRRSLASIATASSRAPRPRRPRLSSVRCGTPAAPRISPAIGRPSSAS